MFDLIEAEVERLEVFRGKKLETTVSLFVAITRGVMVVMARAHVGYQIVVEVEVLDRRGDDGGKINGGYLVLTET